MPVQMLSFPPSQPQPSFSCEVWSVPSQMSGETSLSSVSPKESVVGQGKSHLVREIVTGWVAFTALVHLLHRTFIILKVPGVDKDRDAILQFQPMQLETVHTADTDMKEVILQGDPTEDWSCLVKHWFTQG